LTNALLERKKMMNPQSRGKHPKLIVGFNYTPTLLGSPLAIDFVIVLAGELASFL
jgi:hypothetical protein